MISETRHPRVLLMAMPDVASAFDRVMRIPNLGIASLAANLQNAEVATLDLVTCSNAVGKAVDEHMGQFKPDIVGLSAMTFQYQTACRIAKLVRQTRPEARIVLGGYHATLAYKDVAIDPEARDIDYIVRGEGEAPLNALVKAVAGDGDTREIPGRDRTADGFVHNPGSPLSELDSVKRPDRKSRLVTGFHYFGKPFDVVETSRGCPRGCRFCCIRKMYGESYREYSIERVIDDIAYARDCGARGVFFTDDNISLRPERLRELCRAIVDAGLHTMEFISQADVAGFVKDPELPAEMRRAGFSGVFLGIESVAPENWKFLRKSNSIDATRRVVESLRGHGIGVAGGFILGNPDDDEQAIRATFRAARTLPLDHAIMWCLTPYPGTDARDELMAEGLVVNPDRFERYNGFICNVRTRKLEHPQLVSTLSSEGLKLYLNPAFVLRGRVWRTSPRALQSYYSTVSEFATKGYKNRLFESRHRL